MLFITIIAEMQPFYYKFAKTSLTARSSPAERMRRGDGLPRGFAPRNDREVSHSEAVRTLPWEFVSPRSALCGYKNIRER